MANPTSDEIGYCIYLPGGVGDKASPETTSNYIVLTASTFAIIFSIKFTDDNYNVFFGGSGVSESLKLMRNKTSNKIDLEIIDSAAKHRDYTWDTPLRKGVWYQFIINGTAAGADGIKLYVNGTQQTASAQTNAVGFAPLDSIDFNFGDVDATNLGGCYITKPYFYSAALTAGQITKAWTQKEYPTENIFYAWKFKRPNIGLNKAITLA